MNGSFALLLAATFYGLFGVFSRLISFNIPFFYQQWIRNLATVAVVLILMIIFGGWKKINSRDLIWFFSRSFCGFISFVGIYLGFIYLDFSTNYFLSYAAATITGYLSGRIFFKETINPKKMLALLMSIGGVALIYAINWQQGKTNYMILSLVAGGATAGWNTFSKKISGTYSNLQLNLFDFSFATILPLSISFILKEQWTIPNFSQVWLLTGLFAVMFLVIGLLIVYGFSKVEAQIGSLILLFDIIVGLLLGYFFFGEKLTLFNITGGILILGAILLPNINLKKTKLI